jgi:predicted metalloprotease with PDZ domain
MRLTVRIFRVRSALAALSVFVAVGANAKPAMAPDIGYTIKVAPAGAVTEWHVKMKMKGNASGVTELEIPSRWASRDDLGKGIQDLRVSGKEVILEDAILDDEAVQVRRVRHPPGEAITIEYRLTRIGNPDPESQKDAYAPVLSPQYFQVIGNGAWIVPRGERTKRFTIAMNWQLPADWSIANSFGANQRTQTFNTTLQNFRHALYLGGDFRLASFTVRNQPVWIAIRSDWGFFDENLVDLAKRVFETERNFWNDHSQPYYLISVIPVGRASDGVNTGGTALENAFAMFLAPRTQLKDIRFLLTHEYFHNWNPQKLGDLKSPEPLMYWWSEGVTDFYTQRLMLRSGLTSPKEFAKAYNDALRAYHESKARNAPNTRINAEFWKDAAVGKLPYQRGMLFAAVLDREIKTATNGRESLDDVMRDLFSVARKPGAKPLDADIINAAISKRLGRSYAAEIKRDIEEGQTVELSDATLGACFERKLVGFRPYETGFDVQTSIATRKVTGVDPNSAAYAAGLRDGMVAQGWSIHHGDPTKEIEVVTSEGDKRRTIKFFPVAKVEVVAPQFYLKPGLDKAALAKCD